MKIYKISSVIRNISIHVVLSAFYLHILESLSLGRTAIGLSSLKESLLSFSDLKIVFFVTILFVVKVSKFSPKIFLVFCGIILFNSINIFFISFDKFILVLNFAYISFSFVLYILLKSELKESFYVPGFHKNSIYEQAEYNLEAVVKSSTGQEIQGYLTNWGPRGCFFMPYEKQMINGSIQLSLEFDKRKFLSEGKVMTSYGKGYGILMVPSRRRKNRFLLEWGEYYDIISQRGYAPRNL